jgi:3-mercaptopyruvate sulfurtransferase SseA
MPVPRITKEDLKARLDNPDSAPTIVDARLKYPYEHSSVTLPGAIRVRPGATNVPLPAGRDVVLYDSDPDELASERLAIALVKRGYQVSVLKGGIGDWVTAKLPVDTKESPQVLPPAAKP